MSDMPKVTDESGSDPSNNVLSEMAQEDVEQPGDTPSDVPPVAADETEAMPKKES